MTRTTGTGGAAVAAAKAAVLPLALAQFVASYAGFDMNVAISSIASVWVPQTLHTSRDLLILVEKSTEQVLSSDLVDLGCCPVGEQL